MRWPDARHWFTPNDEPAHNLWFSRDPQAIAAAKGLGPVAPFYVEQESPAPPGGLPQPGKLVVELPDNHLQYALTWYGLAIVLVVSFRHLGVRIRPRKVARRFGIAATAGRFTFLVKASAFLLVCRSLALGGSLAVQK